MNQAKDLTKGPIVGPLFRFTLPILAALFLQSLYGAVDLFVVGRFSGAQDVSAVATGSQLIMLVNNLVVAFSMGCTVLLGQKIGARKKEEGGDIVGTAILMFLGFGVILSILLICFATPLTRVMNAPEEAFAMTRSYILICGGGMIAVVAYNLLGSIFRGMGDSKTPLIAVSIATIVNVFGDLLLVAVFHMGAAGAAIATVGAQVISVLLSLLYIRRLQLPFEFSKQHLKVVPEYLKGIVNLGLPLALQDFLVSISFIIMRVITNDFGVIASAGVGVASKVTAFIMLIPSSCSQSVSAFVAQCKGAKLYSRARKTLWYAIAVSTCVGILMFYLNFFHGQIFTGIFSNETPVIAAAVEYLKSYAIDCLQTCFLFCFIGYFNGMGATKFVMTQGLIAALACRIPFAVIMSRQANPTLFKIGLATPFTTLIQIILCLAYYFILKKKTKEEDELDKILEAPREV